MMFFPSDKYSVSKSTYGWDLCCEGIVIVYSCKSEADVYRHAWKHHENNQKQKAQINRGAVPPGYKVEFVHGGGNEGWRGYSPTGSFTTVGYNFRAQAIEACWIHAIEDCWIHYDEELKEKQKMKNLPSYKYLLAQDENGNCVLYYNAQRIQDYFGCEADALNFAWQHYNEELKKKVAALKQKQDRRSAPTGYVIIQDSDGKVRCGEGYDFEDNEFDSEIYADHSLTWEEALKACWEDYDLHKQLNTNRTLPEHYSIRHISTGWQVMLNGHEIGFPHSNKNKAIDCAWKYFNAHNMENKVKTNIPVTITRNNKEFHLRYHNDQEIVYKVKDRFDETNTKPGMIFYCETAKCFWVITKARYPEKWNTAAVGYNPSRPETTGHEGFNTQKELIGYLNSLPSCYPCDISTLKVNGKHHLTTHH